MIFSLFQASGSDGNSTQSGVGDSGNDTGTAVETPAPDNDDSTDEESAISPSTSTAKRYDPKNCKKVRKLSAAQMQDKEIKMREERQAAFMSKINLIHGKEPDNDDSGDADFARMIEKQMRTVFVSFCDLCSEK